MKSFEKSKGVALIVGLIFLILLTLFVLGGMRDVLLQERMAGAYRNESLAKTSRDSLLRNAEARIFAGVVARNGGVVGDYFGIDSEIGTAGLGAVTAFRTGVGYITGGTGPTQSFQNTADTKNDLSKPGAYVIEGPIPVNPDTGLEGSNAPSNNGGLESHTSPFGTESSGSGDGSKGGAKGNIFTYRITARATGGTDDFVRAGDSNYSVTN